MSTEGLSFERWLWQERARLRRERLGAHQITVRNADRRAGLAASGLHKTGAIAEAEDRTRGWHDGRAHGMLWLCKRIPHGPAGAGLTTFSHPVKESLK